MARRVTSVVAFAAIVFSAVCPAPRHVTADPPSRTAFATLTEQFADKVVKVTGNGHSFPVEVRSGTFQVSGAIPLTGIDIANFLFDTQIKFDGELGGLMGMGDGEDGLIVMLGDDPRYVRSAKKVTITRSATTQSGRTVKLVTINLKWTASVMNFTVKGIIDNDLGSNGLFAQEIVDGLNTPPGGFAAPATVRAQIYLNNGDPAPPGTIGDVAYQLTLNLTGARTVKRQVVGRGDEAQTFDLDKVQLKGTTTDVQNIAD